MKKILVSVCAALMLCLALAGISGCSTDYTKNYTGTWDLSEITSDDSSAVVSANTMTGLRNMGVDIFVNFNEDKTFQVSYAGNVISGTWEAQSDSISVTSDDSTQTLKYADKQLSWVTDSDKNTVMIFVKSDTEKTIES